MPNCGEFGGATFWEGTASARAAYPLGGRRASCDGRVSIQAFSSYLPFILALADRQCDDANSDYFSLRRGSSVAMHFSSVVSSRYCLNAVEAAPFPSTESNSLVASVTS